MFAGNDRVITLLEMLGLSDRIMRKGRDVEDVLVIPIDWEKVDVVLKRKREESVSFLINAFAK